MYKLSITLLAGSALALGACGGNKTAGNTASNNAMAATSGNAMSANMTAPAGAAATAAAWPEGSRIVSENGMTYRVDAGGARVQLGANDSRIVVERGVRYRVDPDGMRTRIGPDGLKIGDSVIRGNAPNGRSDVETPGEAMTDAGEDAAEAVGDVIPD